MPSVSFWSQDNDYSGVYKTTIYHTQYDTASLINWPFLGDISKFQFRVAKKFDRGLLPYTLAARSTDLTAALRRQRRRRPAGPTVDDVIAKSVGKRRLRRLRGRRAALHAASDTFDAVAEAGQLPAANLPAINAQLMQIEKLVNTSFTALDWLDNTTYPFDQITRDIYRMQIAYDALDSGTPDYDTAAGAVGGTGLMWYGTNFSRPVFKKVLQQHRQSYYHVAWGGQGHLEKYQDLMPEYNADPRRRTPRRRWTC